MSKALYVLGTMDSKRKEKKRKKHKTKPKHKLGSEREKEAFSEGKLEAVSLAKQHMFYGVMKFPWLI